MSKRKPMDKAQARERRNRLLETAAAAELSLTEGVCEMRAISGMTQEEFARHREVSARVIKAIELGQGNPTVATLNRIGQFFGLEVAFVPVKRAPLTTGEPQPATVSTRHQDHQELADALMERIREGLAHELNKMFDAPDDVTNAFEKLRQIVPSSTGTPLNTPTPEHMPGETAAGEAPVRKKRKPRSS
jgi:DNA-binding XRE family transcriptional regulator